MQQVFVNLLAKMTARNKRSKVGNKVLRGLVLSNHKYYAHCFILVLISWRFHASIIEAGISLVGT